MAGDIWSGEREWSHPKFVLSVSKVYDRSHTSLVLCGLVIIYFIIGITKKTPPADVSFDCESFRFSLSSFFFVFLLALFRLILYFNQHCGAKFPPSSFWVFEEWFYFPIHFHPFCIFSSIPFFPSLLLLLPVLSIFLYFLFSFLFSVLRTLHQCFSTYLSAPVYPLLKK